MRWKIAAIVVLSLFVATAAHGADSKKRAAELFKKGEIAYSLGKFSVAVGHFEKAFELLPDPVILFNLAQCHRMLGNAKQSIFFYKGYLRAVPKAPNKREVLRWISELEKLLKKAAKTADMPPTGTLKGKELPPPDKVEPDPAPPPDKTEPEPDPSPAKDPEPALPPDPGPGAAGPTEPPPPTDPAVSPPAEPVEPPPPPKKTPVYKRWWFWTAIGVVVVGATLGGIAGAMSADRIPETDLGEVWVFW
jgi:hypothetical protein